MGCVTCCGAILFVPRKWRFREPSKQAAWNSCWSSEMADLRSTALPWPREKAVRARIQQLKIDAWLQVEVQGRTLGAGCGLCRSRRGRPTRWLLCDQERLSVAQFPGKKCMTASEDRAEVERGLPAQHRLELADPCTHRSTHARSCSGGDAGLSHPAGLEPGLGGLGRDRRRGTPTVEGPEFQRK